MPRLFGIPEDLINKVINKEEPISTYSPYLSPLHDRHVIGVNAAFLIGSWMDFVFFGDGRFFTNNRKELLRFPKPKVSCNPNQPKHRDAQYVRQVPRDRNHPEGLTSKPNHVSWNKNSGAAAINFAYHLGARRILLLGFDMKRDSDKNQHWHAHYYDAATRRKTMTEDRLPFARHLKSFGKIRRDAKHLGLEILNVSDDTALESFRCVMLKDVL